MLRCRDGKVKEIVEGIKSSKTVIDWMVKYNCEEKEITQEEVDAEEAEDDKPEPKKAK